MHEAGVVANVLGQVGQEGDDVVFDLGLDLVDAGDLEGALVPNRLGCLFWHVAQFRLGVHGVGLNLQPDAEFLFRLP